MIAVANSRAAASTSVNRRCRAVGVIVAIEDSNSTLCSVKAVPTNGRQFDLTALRRLRMPSVFDNIVHAFIVNLVLVKGLSMSALGQKQTFGPRNAMSALPPKADISERDRH